MPDPNDRSFLVRAIALAMRGRGAVEPNPMVGCVIVRGGKIIGEGYHAKYGGPHAEPTALASCTQGAAGATAYVTLEPCCHTDKKTPPCVPALLRAQIARVVVGAIDPNPMVHGKGLQQLRAAGVDVVENVATAEAMQLLAPFIARTVHHRPYVTLKWAQSDDAKVAGPGGTRLPLSGIEANEAVHRLRSRCDAILIGSGTALNDDPLLTIRGIEPNRPLRRVVLDSLLRLPLQSQLVKTARRNAQAPLIVYCGQPAYTDRRHRAEELRYAGVEVVPLPVTREERVSLEAVLHDLWLREVTHLLVEPGPRLARSFLSENLWDRAWRISAPLPVNDPTAPAAVVPSPATTTPSGAIPFGPDVVDELLNTQSPLFFAQEPSADLYLEKIAREI